MAETGFIRVKETTDYGRTYREHVYAPATRFVEATDTLHEWLWLNQSRVMALHVIMTWMRGEIYSDHSVSVRYYVPGTVGHWFEFLYVA